VLFSTIVRQFFPAGPGKLDIEMWGLIPSEMDEAEREHALRSIAMFWGPGGFGSADDVDILESCQTACANPEPEWSIVSRGMVADRAARFDDDIGSREFWKRWHAAIAPDAPAAGEDASNLLRFAARGA
jgi:benzoate/toluate 1,2-dioxygenase alpha subunit